MTAGGASQRWSKDKPKAPGWYWWRNKPIGYDVQVVKVRFLHGWGQELFVSFETGDKIPFKEINGEWCGPLEPPHDQEAGT